MAIATGHYARTKQLDNHVMLLKGKDENKDQSYFLALLNEQQLAKSIFPLGDYSKPEVRKMAEKLDLPNFAKKDSTGICFIGERPFKAFLQQYLPAQPGDMVSDTGKILGHHEGLMYYTIGQRQGLGIGGSKENNDPWYVADKDLENNRLIVVQGSDHPMLFKSKLTANAMHWINGKPELNELKCSAKTRYRQSDQNCRVKLSDNDIIQVEFESPQRAITPGQYLVLYNNDICLGGGVIC